MLCRMRFLRDRAREEIRAVPRASAFGRYWRGEGPLWRVYWIYGAAASRIITSLIVVSAVLRWFTPTILAGALTAAGVYSH